MKNLYLKLSIFLSIVVCLSFSNPVFAQGDEVKQLLEKAKSYVESKSYSRAKYELDKAIKLDPDNAEVKNELEKVQQLIQADKEAKARLQGLLKEAEQYYRSKDYKNAKESYKQILLIDNKNRFANDRLKQIAKVYLDPEEEAAFNEAISNADQYLTQERYDDAIASYEEAALIKPGDVTISEKIKQVKEMKAAGAKIQALFDENYSKAIELEKQSKYGEAIGFVEKALKYRPGNKEASNTLNRLKSSFEQAKEIDARYKELIDLADNQYIERKFEDAKQNYLKAKEIKPSEAYPQSMIDKIEPALAKAAEQKAAYDLLIKKADQLSKSKSYEEAILKYEEAIALDASSDYPAEQIESINNLMKSEADRLASYQRELSLADSLLSVEQWDNAKTHYQKAKTLNPDESYPSEQISKIDDTLEQIRLFEEEYVNTMTNANSLMDSKKWGEAKSEFAKASQMKPDESLPKEKIAEIENILEKLAKAEESYKETIAEADRLLTEKNYEQSRLKYQEAKNYKPEMEYPDQKIQEIDEALAALAEIDRQFKEFIDLSDALVEEDKYEDAISELEKALKLKSAEEELINSKKSEIALLIKARDEKLELIASSLQDAEGKLLNKEYEQAKAGFEKVIELDPSNMIAKTKLAETENILAELYAKEKEYYDAVNEGDSLLKNNAYSEAKLAYETALSHKAEATYPVDQLKLIEAKILEIAMKEAAYNEAIDKADALYAAKDLNEAKNLYVEASGIKSEEEYPKNQIALIDDQLAKAAQLKESYESAKSLADSYYDKEKFEQALEQYELAWSVKTEDPIVGQRIEEIKSMIAGEAEREERFTALMKSADSLYAREEWQLAMNTYKQAAGIKPKNKEIKEKLKGLEVLAAESAQKDLAYNDAIRKADMYFKQNKLFTAKEHYQTASEIRPKESYPVQQLNQIDSKLREIEAEFKSIAIVADSLYANQIYHDARKKYEEALLVKPDDEYAKKMLRKVDNSLEKIRLLMMEQYGEAIRLADSYYNSGFYDEAIPKYQEAAYINPADPYPIDKAEEIMAFLKEHVLMSLVPKGDSLVLQHDQEKHYDYQRIEGSMLKNSYLVIKAQNMDDSNVRLFISYGKNGQKSGGVVLKNIQAGEPKEYLIRISAHERWVSIDNNYIDLYSEGGVVKLLTFDVVRGR